MEFSMLCTIRGWYQSVAWILIESSRHASRAQDKSLSFFLGGVVCWSSNRLKSNCLLSFLNRFDFNQCNLQLQGSNINTLPGSFTCVCRKCLVGRWCESTKGYLEYIQCCHTAWSEWGWSAWGVTSTRRWPIIWTIGERHTNSFTHWAGVVCGSKVHFTTVYFCINFINNCFGVTFHQTIWGRFFSLAPSHEMYWNKNLKLLCET